MIRNWNLFCADVERVQGIQNAEYLHNPQDDDNNDHAVKYAFDFSIHGQVCVYEPEQNSDNHENYSDV